MSLCASDSVKLFVATLLVHRLVHLEQVYTETLESAPDGISTVKLDSHHAALLTCLGCLESTDAFAIASKDRLMQLAADEMQ